MSENDPFDQDQKTGTTSRPAWNADASRAVSELGVNPKLIVLYVQLLLLPFLVAAFFYVVSDSLFAGVLAFAVMLAKSFSDLRRKALAQRPASASGASSAAGVSAESANQGYATSANAVNELKRKLEQLRDGDSLAGVELDAAAKNEPSDESHRETDPFDQGHAESGLADFADVDKERSEILKDMDTPRDTPTEKQTQIWLEKLSKLDELVAYGNINDKEHERQYRRIKKAYQN